MDSGKQKAREWGRMSAVPQEPGTVTCRQMAPLQVAEEVAGACRGGLHCPPWG